MKAIMKTIKPKTCANIMNLIQSILVIKDKREATAIRKLIDENGYADIYVYCTKDKEQLTSGHSSDIKGTKYFIYNDNEAIDYRGKVLFKFRCYKVEEIDVRLGHPEIYVGACIDDLWCLDNGYHDKNYMARAIYISDLEIFGEPKELSEFKQLRDSYGKVNWNTNEYYCMDLINPPKNYCYVGVE